MFNNTIVTSFLEEKVSESSPKKNPKQKLVNVKFTNIENNAKTCKVKMNISFIPNLTKINLKTHILNSKQTGATLI
jgi:hypothetical protein